MPQPMIRASYMAIVAEAGRRVERGKWEKAEKRNDGVKWGRTMQLACSPLTPRWDLTLAYRASG